jgi:hypothetical protein
MTPEEETSSAVSTGGPGVGAGIRIMLRYSLVLVAGFWVAGSAGAATWADGLFSELSKDFGSVPRGKTLTHYFRIVNNTRSSVNISSVRVSCGCTSTTLEKTVLKPGEDTALVASMDTTRFIGPRTVTIYVQFDRPKFEEVRLWVQANARNDFSVTPDSLAFGQVKRGTTPGASVSITFYGIAEARILSVRPESNYILPAVVEVRRQDAEVVYTLTAKMRPDTPVGKWFTDVWMKTNLTNLPQVRVPLTVEVESPLTISPAVVTLGLLHVDDESERRVIVRGVKPFRITRVKGGDANLEVKTNSSEPREVHVLTVKLKPAAIGSLERTLRVVTDLVEDNEIDFRVSASVMP